MTAARRQPAERRPRVRPETVANRALFPTARVPGHPRPRVPIPTERQLLRGRSSAADRAVLGGFLSWLALLLAVWGLDVGGGTAWPSGWLVLASLPTLMALFVVVDMLMLLGDRGTARWHRWARARGLRVVRSRTVRGSGALVLREADGVPVLFAGNVGGYRLGVGSAFTRDEEATGGPHFHQFVYARLPERPARRIHHLLVLPVEGRADAELGMRPLQDALPGRLVLVAGDGEEHAAREVLSGELGRLLTEQPHVGLEQVGPHLAVWSPGAGSYARVLVRHVDPDLDPAHLDTLCEVAVCAVQRWVAQAAR